MVIRLFVVLILTICFLNKSAYGQFGLTFDKVNDGVTIPYHEKYSTGTGDFTLEAWIKFPESENIPTDFPTIISNRGSNARTGLWFGVWRDGTLLLINDNVSGLHSSGHSDVRDDTCHHVAVAHQSSTRTTAYYLDGKFVGTGRFPGNVDEIHGWDIGIEFSTTAGSPVGGNIRDVRIWNVERTEQQIASAMNTVLNGTEEGLIGHWLLNEGTGQTVRDNSTTQNDGYLGISPDIEDSDPLWDTAACVLDFELEGKVTVYTITDSSKYCIGDTVELSASNGNTYNWHGNPVPINSWEDDSLWLFVYEEPTWITVEDERASRDSLFISSNSLEKCSDLIFYEYLTPNGDGVNDVFKIIGLDVKLANQLNVYDVWGREVYSSNAYQNNWSPIDVREGEYAYFLETAVKQYQGVIYITK